MSANRCCPQCGAELPSGAPEGLCPACLLRAGLVADAAGGAEPTVVTPPNSGFVPPAPEELAARFPHLEILDLLGTGGMGAVYKARQPHLDRYVALKILPPELGGNPAFEERFGREARAMARLSHPHIVAIYDFGQADGLYYLVMEYVAGTNLRQVIEAKTLAAAEALAVVPQICEALEYAHGEGVVHRDIKPENILLDAKGRVKIADFGLSKLTAGGERESAGVSLTGSHQVMGTLRYMAPEQMQGSRAVDHRADIYSLGVVFYELLTGEVPMGRFDPPSRKVQIDVRLDEVVLKTLEQEPDRRYQRASEVQTDVEAICTGPGAEQPLPATTPPDNGWEHALAQAVMVAALIVLSWVGLGLTVEGARVAETIGPALKLNAGASGFLGTVLQFVLGPVLLLAFSVLVLGCWPTIFVSMGVLMWHLESSWVLAGLAVPWFLLVWFEHRVKEVSLAQELGSFLLTLGLIGYGVLLSLSAWPLLGLVSALAGGFAALLIFGENIVGESESQTRPFDQHDPQASQQAAGGIDDVPTPSAETSGDAPSTAEASNVQRPATHSAAAAVTVLGLAAGYLLTGLAMWLLQSHWALLLLFIPAAVVGATAFIESPPWARWSNPLLYGSFVLSAGLVVYGAWLSPPEAGLIVFLAVMTVAVGMMFGMFVSDASPGSDASEPPQWRVRAPATGLLILSGLITAHLADNAFPRIAAFIETTNREPASLQNWMPLVQWFVIHLGGPVILAGALAMLHLRWYWLALSGALLCMPLSLVAMTPPHPDDRWMLLLGFAVGVWAVAVLSRPDVRAAFAANRTHRNGDDSESGHDANSASTSNTEKSQRGVFRQAAGVWNHCVTVYPGAVKSLLWTVYIVAFILFFSNSHSRGYGYDVEQGAFPIRIEYTIGWPWPWFEFRMERNVGGHYGYKLWSPAWLIAAAAFAALWLTLAASRPGVPLRVSERPHLYGGLWFLCAYAGVLMPFLHEDWTSVGNTGPLVFLVPLMGLPPLLFLGLTVGLYREARRREPPAVLPPSPAADEATASTEQPVETAGTMTVGTMLLRGFGTTVGLLLLFWSTVCAAPFAFSYDELRPWAEAVQRVDARLGFSVAYLFLGAGTALLAFRWWLGWDSTGWIAPAAESGIGRSHRVSLALLRGLCGLSGLGLLFAAGYTQLATSVDDDAWRNWWAGAFPDERSGMVPGETALTFFLTGMLVLLLCRFGRRAVRRPKIGQVCNLSDPPID